MAVSSPAAASAASAQNPQKPWATPVVFLHGLWMAGYATAIWRKAAFHGGFQPTWFSYPSVTQSLDRCADLLRGVVDGIDAPNVHLVGHSLGGLVIAHWLKTSPEYHARVGRVVLCGSPINGTTVGKTLADNGATRWMVGATLRDASARDMQPPAALRDRIGVIAGNRAFGAGMLLAKVPRPHDGTVAVAETRIEGAHHLELPVTHTGLLTSSVVTRAMLGFLRDGNFGNP
jgi:pimeloyl-ACP methyl ester carboxylesterase